MTERRLTAQRLTQMQECFEQALDLEPGGREEFLRTVSLDDADLASQVRGLLAAHLGTGRTLRSPVAGAAAMAHEIGRAHV